MITINGQKMGKSLGNFITLEELFTGNHKLLTQAYSPMTIRFFVLQAHYRSTLDFFERGVASRRKGTRPPDEGCRGARQDQAVGAIHGGSCGARNPLPRSVGRRPELADGDFRTVRLGAHHQSVGRGAATDHGADLEKLREIVRRYVFDILGFCATKKAASAGGKDLVTPLVNMLLDLRQTAKTEKNWALSDKIRDELTAIGIRVKDRKDGCDWEIE